MNEVIEYYTFFSFFHRSFWRKLQYRTVGIHWKLFIFRYIWSCFGFLSHSSIDRIYDIYVACLSDIWAFISIRCLRSLLKSGDFSENWWKLLIWTSLISLMECGLVFLRFFLSRMCLSKMRIIYGHCANMTELQQTDYSSWPKHNWIVFFFLFLGFLQRCFVIASQCTEGIRARRKVYLRQTTRMHMEETRGEKALK